jgi:hypothetical protein
MRWLEGQTLDGYVEQHLSERERLIELMGEFVAIIGALRKAQLAHGDLQHGNILVTSNGKMRLVDYDAMYSRKIAAACGSKSPETGHENYQHPLRSENDFGDDVDNFSALVIYLSLRALAEAPTLWRYNTGQNLILTSKDYKRSSSVVIEALRNSRDQGVVQLTDRLVQYCQGPPDAVKDLFYDLSKISPPPSEDEQRERQGGVGEIEELETTRNHRVVTNGSSSVVPPPPRTWRERLSALPLWGRLLGTLATGVTLMLVAIAVLNHGDHNSQPAPTPAPSSQPAPSPAPYSQAAPTPDPTFVWKWIDSEGKEIEVPPPLSERQSRWMRIFAWNSNGAADMGSISVSIEGDGSIEISRPKGGTGGRFDTYAPGKEVAHNDTDCQTMVSKFPLAEAFYSETWKAGGDHTAFIRVTRTGPNDIALKLRVTLTKVSQSNGRRHCEHFTYPSDAGNRDQQDFPVLVKTIHLGE